uniref:Uncharacterized protein n=1 Tax=Timema douglasi TaxID=61478 RepID=A0A7R8VHQ2_TIMDO|nr:unnamed protein product [Timema douglasi]
MSGQWEVVVKNKQKQNGQVKKLTKTERKRFVENAPKVEDILPLAQVRSLYTTLDNNKENRKPPPKATAKENEPKKAPKKQPEKKEVKEKSPIPKTLELAASQINAKELKSELEIGQARFPEAPLAWLKGLAEYLNAKLDHTGQSVPKSAEYPQSALPSDVKQVILSAIQGAGDSTAQHFYEISFQNPNITLANIPKLTSIRNSYQNRQNIGLAILWAVGQGGVKDLSVGLKAWQEIMLPVLEMKNYSSYVIRYLRDILGHPGKSRTLSPDQFLSVLDVIHTRGQALSGSLRQELAAVVPALRARAFQHEPEKRLQSFFQPLLERLQSSASKEHKEELLTSLAQCLRHDQQSFSVWRQLYTKNLAQSALLLAHLDTNWSSLREQLPVKLLKETLRTFKVTNEELKKGKHKEEHLKDCQKLSETDLKKSYERLNRIRVWNVLRVVRMHACNTGRFLNDIGALQYGEHAWSRTKHYSSKSYQWAEVNVPHYYKIVEVQAKPYVQQAVDLSLVLANQLQLWYGNIRQLVEEKTPVVVTWVEHYAPGLLGEVKTRSLATWDLTKSYAVLSWQYAREYSLVGFGWVQNNVLVGNLSPENLQKYSLEAVNTTQVYVTWTYDWVLQKVQTLSKIK